ncbi:MAG TPA: SMP-30/gluconolactonase/LRE family protein [Candidatus Glassbacteria bacterium]|nr:SMP-30/gluconolactonase/LRE family protein [Candidatus Glassbacteria bacterium]
MKRFAAAILTIVFAGAVTAADVVVVKPEFASVVDPSATLEVIAGEGLQFTEGPVWVPEGGYLLFSDIQGDKICRWQPGVSGYTVWRQPSHQSNGLLLDGQGRVICCEHQGRRLSLLFGPDSAVTLCDSYKGLRLSSPNDVALHPDGSLWFTDPPYGLVNQKPDLLANYVFRLNAGASEPVPVAEDFERPNGIVFSPDKKVLYVDDTQKGHVRSFRVNDGKVEPIGVFAEVPGGGPDGMCVDRSGRLYVTNREGVAVFSSEGVLLGKFLTPKPATNCCFGGSDWNTLFITTPPAVYSIRLKVAGLP